MVIPVGDIEVAFSIEGQASREFQPRFGGFATVTAVPGLTCTGIAGHVPLGVHTADDIVITHGNINIALFIDGDSIDQ